MNRRPVPGRRMGHHRLVGHGAPALAPAAGRRAGNSAARLSPSPRAAHLRNGWSCCPKPRFWQRFSAILNGAAGSPLPVITAKARSTCTSHTALACLQGWPQVSRSSPTRSGTGSIDTTSIAVAPTAPLGAQQSQPGEHSMSSCVPQRERRRLQPRNPPHAVMKKPG